MNLRPNRRRPPEMILIPLLDVLLVLLIFFMVSTTFKDSDASRLHVQLPQAQGEAIPTNEPDHVRIVIDRAGNYYVDDRAVVDQQSLTLVRALTGAIGERKGLSVLIQADANTPHQAVMRALDAAGETGLTKIAFAAARPAAERTTQPARPR